MKTLRTNIIRLNLCLILFSASTILAMESSLGQNQATGSTFAEAQQNAEPIHKDLARLFLNGKSIISLKEGTFIDWLHRELVNNKTSYFTYDPDEVTERHNDGFLLRLNNQRKGYDARKKIAKYHEKPMREAIALFDLPTCQFSLTLFPNQFPYLHNHALLIPNIFDSMPQVLDIKLLRDALEFLNYFKDHRIRLGCSLKQQDAQGHLQTASVDHFHWQLFTNELPIENEHLFKRNIIAEYKNIKIFKIENYPLDAYLFQGISTEQLAHISAAFLSKLDQEKVIHNVLLNYDKKSDSHNVFVVIRNFKAGFGIIEACGCLRIESEKEFNSIQVRSFLREQKVALACQNTIKKSLRDLVLELSIPTFGNYKVIEAFKGNSEAQLYVIERPDGSKEVIKFAFKDEYGAGKNKLKKESLQTRYLHKLFPANYLDVAVDETEDGIVALRMNYVEGKTLEEYLSNGELSLAEKFEYLNLALSPLLSIYSQEKFCDSNDFATKAHLQRVEERLSAAKKKNVEFEQLVDLKHIWINGIQYESPREIINTIQKDPTSMRKVSPPFLSLCAHGDFIPSNVIVSKDRTITFIDVRGVAEEGKAPQWDYIYDLAKLKFYFSSWKFIIDNKFEIEHIDSNTFNLNFLTRDPLWRDFYVISQRLIEYVSQCKKVKNLIEQDPFWEIRLLFSEAMHCLAETTSRIDKGHIEQAKAIYLMGVILLNRVKDIVTNQEKTTFKKDQLVDLSKNSSIDGFCLDAETLNMRDKHGIIELTERYVHNLNDTVFFTDPYSPKDESKKLLYKAKKNFLPIRAEGDYAKQWRFDLTIYDAKQFNSKELNRSSGHLNGEKEIEIFQVWCGKVRIYYQVEAENKIVGVYQDLNPGEYSIIPPGAWHSTHVLEGPAVVANICNREDFFGQNNKPYKGVGAFTFCQEGGFPIVPVVNPQYKNADSILLIMRAPDVLPKNITSKYNNLTELFNKAAPDELEDLAQCIFRIFK